MTFEIWNSLVHFIRIASIIQQYGRAKMADQAHVVDCSLWSDSKQPAVPGGYGLLVELNPR